MELLAARHPGARSSTITLILAALGMLASVATGMLVSVGEISNTSLLLAGVGVSLPLALAALTATTTTLVCDPGRVRFFRATLGWRRLEANFPPDEVLHVCATSPTGRHRKHLLLRTVSGIRCIDCAEAPRLVRALHEDWKHPGGRVAP
jgi:hypothetical protein